MAAAVPTDVIANDLAIRLFLFGLAVMSFYEAFKLERPRAYVPWAATAIFTASGALLTQISRAWPMGVAWLGQLVANPVTWFVFAISIFLILRPRWLHPASPRALTSEAEDIELRRQMNSNTDILNTYSQEARVISERLTALENVKHALVDDYQRMLGMNARFNDDIAGIKTSIQSLDDAFQNSLQIVERKTNEALLLIPKVEQIRVDGAIATRDIEKLDAALKQDRERALSSFQALGFLANLEQLEAEIEQDAADLYDRLKAGERYDTQKWEQWENVYSHWRRTLDDWLSRATWYAIAVKTRILAIDESLYSASWSIEETQFPNAEAVRRFKNFRIIYQNWRDIKPEVKRGLEQVAFHGMSEIDVRSGRPAG